MWRPASLAFPWMLKEDSGACEVDVLPGGGQDKDDTATEEGRPAGRAVARDSESSWNAGCLLVSSPLLQGIVNSSQTLMYGDVSWPRRA